MKEVRIVDLGEHLQREEESILKRVVDLSNLLAERDDQRIQEWLSTKHPVDLGLIFYELDNEKILAIFEMLEYEELAVIIEEADEEIQQRLLQLLDLEEIAHIFGFMSADNVTDILGNFNIAEIKLLLKLMKEESVGDIRHLLGYEVETAGSIMTTEFIALKEHLSAADAWLKIKKIAPKTEVIETIFILDEVKRLVGTVDLRDLIVAPDEMPLSVLTNHNVISVSPRTDQEEVAYLVSKYDLTVIPVVNRKQALIGIITVDDIIDVIEAEASEDMFKMVGISDEEQADSPLTSSMRRRLPWLFVNLATAFLASATVGLFEATINQVVVLAILLPIVAGMGGNAGLQTLSVMIRGLALGEISFRNTRHIFFKEILLGLLHGAAIGLVTGLIVFVWQGNPYLGLVIFLAMVMNMVIAGISGFLIPMTLKAVGVDPALASSIILTTATDVLGFLAFLVLATVFLQHLL